jgi:hypothetical protein
LKSYGFFSDCCPNGYLFGIAVESVLAMNFGETKDQRLQLSESQTSFEDAFRKPWNSSKTLPAKEKEVTIWATTR